MANTGMLGFTTPATRQNGVFQAFLMIARRIVYAKAKPGIGPGFAG
jgi:hypothetical protein